LIVAAALVPGALAQSGETNVADSEAGAFLGIFVRVGKKAGIWE